jgi:hypothetical protein
MWFSASLVIGTQDPSRGGAGRQAPYNERVSSRSLSSIALETTLCPVPQKAGSGAASVWLTATSRRGEIFGPGCGGLAACLDLVDGRVKPTPPRIERLVIERNSDVANEPLLHRAKIRIVLLAVDERRTIGTTAVVRPPQLDGIVLPEAHRTDLIGTGSLAEHESPAARAWKRRHPVSFALLPGRPR